MHQMEKRVSLRRGIREVNRVDFTLKCPWIFKRVVTMLCRFLFPVLAEFSYYTDTCMYVRESRAKID